MYLVQHTSTYISTCIDVYIFSKIQLVVYYQCCVLIGLATTRLCYSPLVAKSARHICNVLAD